MIDKQFELASDTWKDVQKRTEVLQGVHWPNNPLGTYGDVECCLYNTDIPEVRKILFEVYVPNEPEETHEAVCLIIHESTFGI